METAVGAAGAEGEPGDDGLRTRCLQVAYGRRLVIDGVSLSVPSGRLTALIGPNGSGKSTLLGAMARLLAPRAGAVLLDGRSVHHMPTRALARALGILPQSPVVPESLTAYELVSRGRYPHQGALKRWSESDEQAVVRAMRLTGTLDFADVPVDRLSGGQRQRCWIAMTMAQETPVILLDEPTTFLDLRYQVEVLELLRALAHAHGRTVVAVLHDLNLALAYADCVVCLKEGRIHAVAQEGEPLTSETVREVYGLAVTRVSHPITGAPVFLPLPSTVGGAP